MTLHVTALPPTEAGWQAIWSEWEALDEARPIRIPFTGPLWCHRWWAHYRRDTLFARDTLRLYVIRDDAQRLVAVAPMMMTRRPGRSPFGTRELQFLGADTNLTELRGMLTAPGEEAAAAAALFTFLDQSDAQSNDQSDGQSGGQDWVQWHGLPPGAPPGPGFRPMATVTDHVLTLSSDWAIFRSKLPRNVKEALRKGHNSLARDQHAWTMTVLDGQALADALPRLMTLHTLRSQRAGTVYHPDLFGSPRAQAFITDYISHAAHARLFALTIGGQYVALRLGFLYRNELYLYYSGYDPAWSRYSVMTTLVGAAIEWACAQGLERVNLSTGTDVSKTRWRPAVIETQSGYQVVGGLRSRLAFAAVALRWSRA